VFLRDLERGVASPGRPQIEECQRRLDPIPASVPADARSFHGSRPSLPILVNTVADVQRNQEMTDPARSDAGPPAGGAGALAAYLRQPAFGQLLAPR
jgi:hypothetical protein